MITIEGNNFYYSTDHLLKPKPKTYNEIIERIEPIECKLFYNIISSPQCRYERRFGEGRIKEHYQSMNAEDRFKNIFKEQIVYANPKGFFVNKLNIEPRNCDPIKSVSFTFCDYSELPEHFNARGSEFGICFFHDFLQNRGIRSVEYLNENEPERLQKLTFNSPHLIEVRVPQYDMKWENEWRLNYDLPFTNEDIAFVIVPADRHTYFVKWFMDNTADFQDIQILSSDTYTSYTDHLVRYPQQTDNNWRQVRIFNKPNGNGFKVSPDSYNNLSGLQKKMFESKYMRELSCFAKNTILLSYEHAFTSKFLRFESSLRSTRELESLFPNYKSVRINTSEPDESQRDLVMGLFEYLFQEFGEV